MQSKLGRHRITSGIAMVIRTRLWYHEDVGQDKGPPYCKQSKKQQPYYVVGLEGSTNTIRFLRIPYDSWSRETNRHDTLGSDLGKRMCESFQAEASQQKDFMVKLFSNTQLPSKWAYSYHE